MILIRPENLADVQAIHDLTTRAFRGKSYSDGSEPALIDALRQAGALALSLVAEHDGIIIGHVALSPGVAANGSTGWFVLGPISVDPDRQRQGIGALLINAAMVHLSNISAAGCVLIGDTRYYPRHGFIPRSDLAPEGEPAAHYMVRRLDPKASETSVAFHPILTSPPT